MDRKRELHEQIIVFTDQGPIDGPTKERIEARVAVLAIRPIQFYFSPAANPRHELDAEQVRKTEHGRRLAVGIGVNAFRVQVGEVLQQGVENIGGLVGAAGDKVAE